MYRLAPSRISRCSIAAACLVLLASCATRIPHGAPVIDRSTRQPPIETAPGGVSGPVATVPPSNEPAEQRSPYYTVEKGDTLFSIAQRAGRDLKEIAAWNNLDPPYSLRVGQVLAVGPPDGAAVAMPVTPAPRGGGAPPAVNTKLVKVEPLGLKRPYSDATLAEMQSASGAADAAAAAATGPPAATASSPPAAAVQRSPEPQNVETPKAVEPDDASIGWIWPVRGKIIEGFSQTKNKGVDIAGKAGDPVLAAGDGKVLYAGAGVRGYGNFVIIKHNSNLLSVYAHNNKLLVKEREAVKRGQQIAEMGNTDADQVKLHFEIRSESKPVDPLKYLPAR